MRGLIRGLMRGFDNRIIAYAVRNPYALLIGVLNPWMSLRLDGYWKAVSLLFNSLVSSVASTAAHSLIRCNDVSFKRRRRQSPYRRLQRWLSLTMSSRSL